MPHGQAWDRTQDSVVRSRQITTALGFTDLLCSHTSVDGTHRLQRKGSDICGARCVDCKPSVTNHASKQTNRHAVYISYITRLVSCSA
jgi:hypothetical protein